MLRSAPWKFEELWVGEKLYIWVQPIKHQYGGQVYSTLDRMFHDCWILLQEKMKLRLSKDANNNLKLESANARQHHPRPTAWGDYPNKRPRMDFADVRHKVTLVTCS
jgi:hypothetical protein